MPQSPDDEHETRQREVLADVIDRNRADIERRWLSAVRADLERRADVSMTDLRDAMPDYLLRLVQALRAKDGMEGIASAAWADVAREHAVTRVRLGFDIDELVHEFIVLRRVLVDVANEQGILITDGVQAARVTDLIEGAISVAVKSYVESRDYEARRKEAEHVGFITHELRNPLTTATLAAGHLRRATPSPAPTRQLDIMERALRRIASLIDGVLQVERFEAGRVEPRFQELTLGQVVAEPLSLAEAAARAKGLAFDVDVPRQTLVRVDPELTSSALFNIVENAVKYTDSGRVRVEGEERVDDVVIHVRDDCAGLSPEELHTIFEPFQRGHSEKPGTGLGLAIARRAIEAEGGSLQVESSGERGCHFWMTLPRATYGGGEHGTPIK